MKWQKWGGEGENSKKLIRFFIIHFPLFIFFRTFAE